MFATSTGNANIDARLAQYGRLCFRALAVNIEQCKPRTRSGKHIGHCRAQARSGARDHYGFPWYCVHCDPLLPVQYFQRNLYFSAYAQEVVSGSHSSGVEGCCSRAGERDLSAFECRRVVALIVQGRAQLGHQDADVGILAPARLSTGTP
ncbi:MAG: hypothetical protein IPG64_21995 [Haliea sp.]|nr:hypothetical protein [Haliea sp.]